MNRIKSFDDVYRIFGRKRRLMEKIGKNRSLRKKSPFELEKSRKYNKNRLKRILDFLHRRRSVSANQHYSMHSPSDPETSNPELPDPEISRNTRDYLKAVYHMGRMLLNRLDIDERLKEQEKKMLKEIWKFIDKYNLDWSPYDVLRVLTHPSLDCEICHPWILMLNDRAAVCKAAEVRRDMHYEKEKLFSEIKRYSPKDYKRLRKRWEKINSLYLVIEKQEFDDLEERGLVNKTFDIICPHPWHNTIEKIANCPNVMYIEKLIENS